MMPDFTERHSDKIIATVSCFDRVINRRYLAFLSAVDDPTSWINRVNKISRPVKEAGRSYRGFNHFSPADEAVFHAIAQGGVQGVRDPQQRPSRSTW